MLGRVGGALIIALLVARLLLACGQMLHGQMLGWGEEIWPGYPMMRPACEAPEEPVEPPPAQAQAQAAAPGDAAKPAATPAPAKKAQPVSA